MYKPKPYQLVAILGSTAAAGLGGAVIAGAADSPTTPTTPTSEQRGDRGARSGETALTGETKTKVEAAALAKVPGGTVLRSETDAGGVYEAHVRKADGTDVEVKVDKAFAVTAVTTAPAGGRGRGGFGGGHGGPGGRGFGGNLTAVAKDLGVTEAKLQAAVEAARPDKTAADKADRRADRAAELAKALGVDTADVQAVLEENRPDGGGRGKGGLRGAAADPALVKALADKLSVSEAKVTAAIETVRKAHEAEHTERETALYAAVAKTLGKSAADVRKAFEDNRPAKPSAPATTPTPTPTP